MTKSQNLVTCNHCISCSRERPISGLVSTASIHYSGFCLDWGRSSSSSYMALKHMALGEVAVESYGDRS